MKNKFLVGNSLELMTPQGNVSFNCLPTGLDLLVNYTVTIGSGDIRWLQANANASARITISRPRSINRRCRQIRGEIVAVWFMIERRATRVWLF